METRREKAVRLFKEGYNCSQSVFATFSDLYGINTEMALKLSSSFGGGMGRMREVCGAVSGMLLVIGLETGAIDGQDREQKKYNYQVVQQLAEEFKKNTGSIICKELLGLAKKGNSFTNTMPEQRTEEYYKKRPCIKLVEDAVDMIDCILLENQFFQKVESEKQIEKLSEVADQVWHEYFTSILSIDQINYMVEKFQSKHAITEQINKGYQYYMMVSNQTVIGYFGIHPEEKMFLSKLYLLKDYRGKGYASRAFAFIEKITKNMGLSEIWLTVNRYNMHTIQVYEKKGFQIMRDQVTDIGNGYVMDDYIMEKSLTNLNEMI